MMLLRTTILLLIGLIAACTSSSPPPSQKPLPPTQRTEITLLPAELQAEEERELCEEHHCLTIQHGPLQGAVENSDAVTLAQLHTLYPDNWIAMEYVSPFGDWECTVRLRIANQEGCAPWIVVVEEPDANLGGLAPTSMWELHLPVPCSEASARHHCRRIYNALIRLYPQLVHEPHYVVGVGNASPIALQLANRYAGIFEGVAFSGSPPIIDTLDSLHDCTVVHYFGEEHQLDLMAGRAWIHDLQYNGHPKATSVDGNASEAIAIMIQLSRARPNRPR